MYVVNTCLCMGAVVCSSVWDMVVFGFVAVDAYPSLQDSVGHSPI